MTPACVNYVDSPKVLKTVDNIADLTARIHEDAGPMLKDAREALGNLESARRPPLGEPAQGRQDPQGADRTSRSSPSARTRPPPTPRRIVTHIKNGKGTVGALRHGRRNLRRRPGDGARPQAQPLEVSPGGSDSQSPGASGGDARQPASGVGAVSSRTSATLPDVRSGLPESPRPAATRCRGSRWSRPRHARGPGMSSPALGAVGVRPGGSVASESSPAAFGHASPFDSGGADQARIVRADARPVRPSLAADEVRLAIREQKARRPRPGEGFLTSMAAARDSHGGRQEHPHERQASHPAEELPRSGLPVRAARRSERPG